jgi:predicted CXXCH cytochrome family protein
VLSIIILVAVTLAAFLAGFVLLPPSTPVLASPVLLQEATPTPTPEQAPTSTLGCEECHPEIQKEWYESRHSPTRTDHVLEQANDCSACHPQMIDGQMVPPGAPVIDRSGEPGMGRNCVVCHTTGYDPQTQKSKSYGVTCEACHSPISKNHPDQGMPIYTGTDMCARCHSDSRFNWSEWENSRHYQQYMSCNECHNPHTTGLRNVSAETPNNSLLCLKCHEITSDMSPYSIHGRAGVTCDQCHLGEKKGQDAFHVVPNHSFKVQIETCKKCHEAQLHRAQEPGEDVPAAVNINPSPTPYVVEPTATEEEKPAGSSTNLILVAVLTSLVGLLLGIAFSSRLKNFFT